MTTTELCTLYHLLCNYRDLQEAKDAPKKFVSDEYPEAQKALKIGATVRMNELRHILTKNGVEL